MKLRLFLAVDLRSPIGRSLFALVVGWGEFAGRAGQEDEDEEFLPFIVSTKVLSRGCESQILRDSVSGLGLDWVSDVTVPLGLTFSESLVLGYGELLFELLEGDPGLIEVDSGSLWRSVTLMHDFDLLPPYVREDPELERYLVDVAGLLEVSPDRRPAFVAVRDLWIRSFPGGGVD